MTGKTHQLLGLTSGIITFTTIAPYQYGPATAFAALFLSYIGALIPDLDRSTARIWSFVPWGHAVGRLVDPLFSHRNFSHSLVGILFFALILWRLLKLFPSYWGVDVSLVFICFVVAYLSHMLSDMLTVEGIPLLFPWKRSLGFPPRPFQGVRIVTGKWFENFVNFAINKFVIICYDNFEMGTN